MHRKIAKNQYLTSLKNYLIFLKEFGYKEIPLEQELNFSFNSSDLIESDCSIPASVHENRLRKVKFPNLTLKTVKEELGDCRRCKLCEGRTNIVFGSGNSKADIVFVGEGPGADEDEKGLPFVGRAGRKLTEIIEQGMGLNREKDTYICNIVKCRPPGNRNPEKDEIEACKPFLIKQLRAIAPKVIIALGKPAASTLLGRNVAIKKERGQWHQYENIPLMLTYHPAYLLRSYTLENRKAVFEDMQKVLQALKK